MWPLTSRRTYSFLVTKLYVQLRTEQSATSQLVQASMHLEPKVLRIKRTERCIAEIQRIWREKSVRVISNGANDSINKELAV